MMTKNWKMLIGLCSLCLHLSIFSTVVEARTGGADGGGGDASEERFNEVRADILKWIQDGGAKNLKLPADITYAEYSAKMIEILKPKNVIVGFVEKDDEKNEELQVIVGGLPKTCRGFFSKIDSRPHILCNIQRFKNTSDDAQYRLIHHEYAGLVNLEKNEGPSSDYEISQQLSNFLTVTQVLKLSVTQKFSNCTMDPESLEKSLNYAKNEQGMQGNWALELPTVFKLFVDLSDYNHKKVAIRTALDETTGSHEPYYDFAISDERSLDDKYIKSESRVDKLPDGKIVAYTRYIEKASHFGYFHGPRMDKTYEVVINPDGLSGTYKAIDGTYHGTPKEIEEHFKRTGFDYSYDLKFTCEPQ